MHSAACQITITLSYPIEIQTEVTRFSLLYLLITNQSSSKKTRVTGRLIGASLVLGFHKTVCVSEHLNTLKICKITKSGMIERKENTENTLR